MKRQYQQGTGLYKYLEEAGVLTNGTETEISQAKKKYWTKYRKEWKKNKRQQSKVYILMVSFKEARVINHKAQQLCITPSQYIKHSALVNKDVLGPVLLGRIREQLMLCGSRLEEIVDENFVSKALKDAFSEIVNQMEESILSILSKKV